MWEVLLWVPQVVQLLLAPWLQVQRVLVLPHKLLRVHGQQREPVPANRRPALGHPLATVAALAHWDPLHHLAHLKPQHHSHLMH